ncbi:MAG: hypothetical protein M1838_003516 [Thelocarpon superellum]|nr:MAG: hypothetical protein M1838_003516 [Thelocarpon superellum]
MANAYKPSSNATLAPPWSTAILSQRDLAIQIPINFVTRGGIVFSAACFAHQVYEDDGARQCASDLISIGYRQFLLDLYWDARRQLWSLCPVSIPDLATDTTAVASTASHNESSTARSDVSIPTPLITASMSHNAPLSHATPTTALSARQVDLNSSLTTPSTSGSNATSSLSSPLATTRTSSTSTSTSTSALYELGPYTCTASLNISLLIEVFQGFFEASQDTLDARLLTIILNLHAAANASSPNGPAQTPSRLPQGPNLLGALFRDQSASMMYMPSDLEADRSNLNKSWYAVSTEDQPDSAYLITQPAGEDDLATVDGWPSEGYIEFSQAKRLLLGMGSVDPQMAGYNFTGDAETVFTSGTLQSQRQVAASSDGQLTAGCVFSSDSTDVAVVNSSWAVASQAMGFNGASPPSSSLDPITNLAMDLTNCGISPIVNTTLLNRTAVEDTTAYVAVWSATIWSWAAGQPRNFTAGDDGSAATFRCGVMTRSLGGRWQVDDCAQSRYPACRVNGQPYVWQMGSAPASYSSSSTVCAGNSSFAAPRTALENAYLYAQLQRRQDLSGVWVDINSLAVQGCWVSGGPNATCPYYESEYVQRRNIIIPTVAAIIVLVITGLTLFAKCGVSRRIRRRRTKRGEDAVTEYEGVPA